MEENKENIYGLFGNNSIYYSCVDDGLVDCIEIVATVIVVLAVFLVVFTIVFPLTDHLTTVLIIVQPTQLITNRVKVVLSITMLPISTWNGIRMHIKYIIEDSRFQTFKYINIKHTSVK